MNETHLHPTLEQLAQLSAGMFGDYWCLFQYRCSWYNSDLCFFLSICTAFSLCLTPSPPWLGFANISRCVSPASITNLPEVIKPNLWVAARVTWLYLRLPYLGRAHRIKKEISPPINCALWRTKNPSTSKSHKSPLIKKGAEIFFGPSPPWAPT